MADSSGRHFKQAEGGTSSGTGASGDSGPQGSGATSAPSQDGAPFETMQFVVAAEQNAAQKGAGVSSGASHAAAGSTPSAGDAHHVSAVRSDGAPRAVYPAGGQDMSSGAQQVQPVRQGAHFAGGPDQVSGSGRRSGDAQGDHEPNQVYVGAAAGVQPVAPSSYTANNQKGGKRKQSKLATALIVIGIALLLVAGGILLDAIMGYREAEESYTAIEEEYLTDDDGDGVPSVDFDALAQINPDIVGWIYIPGTEINYPVVQTTDNTTYLTKMFDEDENSNGAIFMDYENTAPGMVDQQTTIYGHHMNDGSMFKFIDDTVDQDDFDTVEVVYYITPDATYVLSPLFTTVVDETYIEARTANFADDYPFSEYLQDMYGEASAVADDAEERLSSTEQVLSLVTCAGDITPRTTRAVMVCAIDEVVAHE